MGKFLLILVVFFLINNEALSAAPSIQEKSLYPGKLGKQDALKRRDSLFLTKLREKRPDIWWRSFFLILAKTGVETFTNAPAIMRQIRDIRNTQVCPYILIVWYDDGQIGEKQFKGLIEKYFEIRESDYLKTFISNELVEILGRNFPNSMVYYFYNEKIIYQHDGKYDFFPNNPLPYDLINVTDEGLIKITDTAIFRSSGSIVKAVNDTLCLELADAHNERLRLIDLKRGKTIRIFDESRFNVPNLFYEVAMRYYRPKKFINKENIVREVAKLNAIRRSAFKIDNVYLYDTTLYIAGTLNSTIPASRRFYVPYDYKDRTQVIRKGEPVDQDICFVIKSNLNFEVQDILFMPDFDHDNYTRNHMVDPTSFFYEENGKFIVYSYKYNSRRDKTYPLFYARNRHVNFLHEFQRKGNDLVFKTYLPPRYVRDFGESYFYYFTIHIVKTKFDRYIYFSCYPEIFSLNYPKPVVSLLSGMKDSLNYVFHKNLYDTTVNRKIPLKILSNYVYKDKIIAILYVLNNKAYISVFNSKFEPVSRIEFSDVLTELIEDGDSTVVFMTKNYIYKYGIKNGEAYFRKFGISFNPFNSHAKVWQ